MNNMFGKLGMRLMILWNVCLLQLLKNSTAHYWNFKLRELLIWSWWVYFLKID